MKSAVFSRAGVIMVSLAGISFADAGAPIAVEGWRYVEGPNDLHVYVCERPDCVESSRIFFYLDQPNSAALPGIWRKQERAVSGLLSEPSKTFSPSSIELATGRMHSLATSSDGSKSYYEFGDVDGSKWHASLTSASPDAKASRTNLEQFKAALRQLRN